MNIINTEDLLRKHVDEQLVKIRAEIDVVHFAPFFRAKGKYEALVDLIRGLALPMSIPSFRHLVGDLNPAHQHRPNMNDLLLDTQYRLSPVAHYSTTPLKDRNHLLGCSIGLDSLLVVQDKLANGTHLCGKNNT